VPLLHIALSVFEKNQNLKFWWYSKVPQANYLWANFVTLVVAESMLKASQKLKKPSNSSTMNPNAT
jgi:hypothetical protein